LTVLGNAAELPEVNRPVIRTGHIAFRSAPGGLIAEAAQALLQHYGTCAIDQAAVIVAVGDDDFVLRVLSETAGQKIPIYGMAVGPVGFLTNPFRVASLPGRLIAAQPLKLYPLRMWAVTSEGTVEGSLAFGQVSLLRQKAQAAKIRIQVDGVVRMPELLCDGVLFSTPLGSIGYNLSAHGPIVPLSAGVLPLTPVSPFRPRRWNGALLFRGARVRFEVIEPERRPVSAAADFHQIQNVRSVTVHEDHSAFARLLFDRDADLSERLVAEQFVT
jgi:NAD+ kinase